MDTSEQIKESEEELMSCLVCPITTEVFHKPVLACDGHIYEESAFNEWWMSKGTSPITGQRIDGKTTRVYNVGSIIDKMIQHNPSLKEMRYQPDIAYSNNRNKIRQYIIDNKFEKLKDFQNYDLIDMFDKMEFIGNDAVICYLLNKCDDVSIINWVLNKCLNIGFQTSTNWNILSLSAFYNNITAFKIGINNGITSAPKLEDGRTLFHIIFEHTDLQFIVYALETCTLDDYIVYCNIGNDYITNVAENKILSKKSKIFVKNIIYENIKKQAVEKYKKVQINKEIYIKKERDKEIEKLKKQMFKKRKNK